MRRRSPIRCSTCTQVKEYRDKYANPRDIASGDGNDEDVDEDDSDEDLPDDMSDSDDDQPAGKLDD